MTREVTESAWPIVHRQEFVLDVLSQDGDSRGRVQVVMIYIFEGRTTLVPNIRLTSKAPPGNSTIRVPVIAAA